MLLDFGDGRIGDRFFSGVFLWRGAPRADDLVEIVRKPILVFRQRIETFLRSLKFADFTRHIGMFERFGGFCRFCAKLLCREHGMLPAWHAPSGFPLDGAVVSVCWMLVTVYRDDQAELRRLLTQSDELAGSQVHFSPEPVDAGDLYFKQYGRLPLWFSQFIAI